MHIDMQKCFEALSFMLNKEIGEPTFVDFADSTYSYFIKNDTNYVLTTKNDGSMMLVVMSPDYSTATTLKSLFLKDTVNSQIVWDLLEQGGISEYGFRVMYKNKVPNQELLNEIDFDTIEINKKS